MKTIHIDGDIGTAPGEISSRFIKSQLPPNGTDPIEVRFHSEGGAVFEAFTIYDAIAAYPGPKHAVVSSMAFSAASLLLCAFDEVEITPNGYLMIHSPRMDDDAELSPGDRKLIAGLRNRMIAIYAAKTRKSATIISRLIDQETFFDAEASVALGLVNRIASRPSLATARLPRHVVAKLRIDAAKSCETRWRDAVATAKQSGLPTAKAIVSVDESHPGLRQKFIDEANKKR